MRLIDIEDMALLKTVSCGGLSAKKLWKRIKEQPTIDAVEVVRCEDCRYRNTWDNPRLEPQYYKCGWGVKIRDYGYVREDDYCPFGKRREESEVGE